MEVEFREDWIWDKKLAGRTSCCLLYSHDIKAIIYLDVVRSSSAMYSLGFAVDQSRTLETSDSCLKPADSKFLLRYASEHRPSRPEYYAHND